MSDFSKLIQKSKLLKSKFFKFIQKPKLSKDEISKFIQKPKLFFKDYLKKQNFKLNSDFLTFFTRKLKRTSSLEKYILLILITLTPFLFSYYYFIGRNKYLVSSSVVLRKAANKNSIPTDFSSIFTGLANQASLNESKYLEVYLKSPEMFQKIEKDLNFSYIYRKKGIDLFSGLNSNSNQDKKYQFFKKQLTIFTNQENGVLEIKVKAFTPEDALFINQFLVKESELFINELNYDISKKQLQFFQNQVDLSKQRLDYEKDRLKEFQAKYKSIDLRSEAESISKVIIALEEEIIKLNIKLLERKRVFVMDDVPEIELIENQIRSLREQIELERGKLVSENEYALNQRSFELNEINNNILFFEELYKTTLAKTESNRIDSIQQQIFLAILSRPLEPEEPWHVWRHRGFLTYLSLLIIISSISKFIFGITTNHTE